MAEPRIETVNRKGFGAIHAVSDDGGLWIVHGDADSDRSFVIEKWDDGYKIFVISETSCDTLAMTLTADEAQMLAAWIQNQG